jgi:hypothetical protein
MKIDVLFDGPPNAKPGRFIEVQDTDGMSVHAGQWRKYEPPANAKQYVNVATPSHEPMIREFTETDRADGRQPETYPDMGWWALQFIVVDAEALSLEIDAREVAVPTSGPLLHVTHSYAKGIADTIAWLKGAGEKPQL